MSSEVSSINLLVGASRSHFVYHISFLEPSGLVVECLTLDRGYRV